MNLRNEYILPMRCVAATRVLSDNEYISPDQTGQQPAD